MSNWQPQYPPQPPQQPRKSRIGLFSCLGCGGLAAIVILIAAVAGAHSTTSSAPVTFHPAQPAVPEQSKTAVRPAAAQTLTYMVTGSAADVTYGPTGTSVSGAVPLNVSGPLGDPLYYSIQAQLQGSGSVTCELEIDGKVISTATASGGYNIAMCEISRDPLSGQWADTNQG